VENAQPTKRRFGFHRWLIVALIVVSVFAVRAYAPVRPHVQVAPEAVLGPIQVPLLGAMSLTNTMLALLLVDIVIFFVALAVRGAVKKGSPVLTGIAGVVELLIEALYNLTESTAGKSARRIFPWMATIILVVLVANLTKLLPGFESIGWLHDAHGKIELPGAGTLPWARHRKTILLAAQERRPRRGALFTVTPSGGCHRPQLHHCPGAHPVVVTQIIGLWLRPGISGQVLNFGRFTHVDPQGSGPVRRHLPFDIFVGFLELVAEVAKIISVLLPVVRQPVRRRGAHDHHRRARPGLRTLGRHAVRALRGRDPGARVRHADSRVHDHGHADARRRPRARAGKGTLIGGARAGSPGACGIIIRRTVSRYPRSRNLVTAS
jgi:F-type H+-transporting ATPase subunit a